MLDKLKQGHYYKIEFISKYKEIGPFFIQISGITKKASTEIYGDYDIRGTFFKDDGILTFLQMYTDDTDVFICHNIKTIDPIEVDIKENILIPESLIDYNKTEEWVTIDKYSFNLTGITRHFDLITDKINYINKAAILIPDKIKETDEFISDIISVEQSDSEILISSSDLQKLEDERDFLLRKKKADIMAMQQSQERERQKLVDWQNDLIQKENKLQLKINTYNYNVNKFNTTIEANMEFVKISERLQGTLRTIYNNIEGIINGTYPKETWETIWNRAYLLSTKFPPPPFEWTEDPLLKEPPNP